MSGDQRHVGDASDSEGVVMELMKNLRLLLQVIVSASALPVYWNLQSETGETSSL